MSLIPQIGNPSAEGRYVVFIRCEAPQAKAWVEPVIMPWHGGRWHSTFVSPRKVLGWIGPLPVLKVEDIEANVPQDFDL